jgi:hypothetical protein
MNVCFALSSAIPSLWGDQRWILMKSIQVLVTMLNPMSIGFECSNPISMFIHFFKSLNAFVSSFMNTFETQFKADGDMESIRETSVCSNLLLIWELENKCLHVQNLIISIGECPY